MPQKLIDQTTIQPDGRPGDDAFTAFATCNENFQDAEQRLTALGVRIDQEVADRGQHVAAESAIREAADAALSARIPGKNIVINGDFRFWQRGTSFVGMTNGAYTADRFIPVMVGDTIDCIRAEHQLGDPTNLFNARYFMRCSVGQVAGNGNLATLQYRIENGVRLLAGKTVTVSMLVRASSATKIGMEFEMTFGTGGSPSASIVGNSQLVTGITGGWQRISRTFTLAGIAGKTFGTTTEGYLSLILWLDAGSNWDARAAGVGRQTGDFQFSNIQIEVGSVATDFEQRPDALELALCQRYYRKSFPTAVVPANNSNYCLHRPATAYNSQGLRASIEFGTTMRVAPAVTFYGGSEGGNLTPASSWRWYDSAGGAWRAATAMQVVGVFQSGFIVDSVTTGHAVASTYLIAGEYTADAEL
ncbi:hypothetical protein [Stenotrophomonas pavanii]|uniref:hypothetical protein n=1 Tax=Stenotrophomonas pavanii TaxID=487698 RepID=UPI0008802234|nr:hypothetical protein [Stenotrophomonas pavanii]SDK77540.1 hypothetical protein SAMN04487784_3344 [Stenotrophomonas pavanii]